MHGHITTRALIVSLLATLGAAASWTFDDGSLAIRGKGAGIDGGAKETLSSSGSLSKAASLSPTDSLKLIITTKEGSTAKKPDQAFLSLLDPATGLEDAWPFTVKENGKAKLDLTHKDIPVALLAKAAPLQATIIIGSFGSSTPYKQHVFDLMPSFDAGSPIPLPETPERLSMKEEIHHIFKADPRSPPKVVSMFFTLAVLATLPLLLAAWAILGANVNHFSTAFGQSPVAHALFFGSILAMEGVFFLYYTSWNLFQTLPAAGVVAAVGYISGSRALTEVQERRLAGQR